MIERWVSQPYMNTCTFTALFSLLMIISCTFVVYFRSNTTIGDAETLFPAAVDKIEGVFK